MCEGKGLGLQGRTNYKVTGLKGSDFAQHCCCPFPFHLTTVSVTAVHSCPFSLIKGAGMWTSVGTTCLSDWVYSLTLGSAASLPCEYSLLNCHQAVGFGFLTLQVEGSCWKYKPISAVVFKIKLASSLSNLEMLLWTISSKPLVPTLFFTKWQLFKREKMTVSNWHNWLEPTPAILVLALPGIHSYPLISMGIHGPPIFELWGLTNLKIYCVFLLTPRHCRLLSLPTSLMDINNWVKGGFLGYFLTS